MNELKELKNLRQLLLNDNYLDSNIKSTLMLQIEDILKKEQFDIEQIVARYETNIKRDSSEITGRCKVVTEEMENIFKEIKSLDQNIPTEKERMSVLIERKDQIIQTFIPKLKKEPEIYKKILKDLQSFADQLVSLK